MKMQLLGSGIWGLNIYYKAYQRRVSLSIWILKDNVTIITKFQFSSHDNSIMILHMEEWRYD
eukprot:UN00214